MNLSELYKEADYKDDKGMLFIVTGKQIGRAHV